ncbi:MAG: hypothetical protein EAX96_00135 [Candidatus Lokiarchaeota archaeon]|nr:hypothetical protein [Candidatus Lokiarchaeota archaeon]
MVLEKLLSAQFEFEIEKAFKKILARNKMDESLLEQDKDRLEILITKFDPYTEKELSKDFLIAACDGSGIENLCQYQDNHIQLVNSSLIVLDTNTVNKQPMKIIDLKSIPSLNNGNLLKIFTFNHDNIDFKNSFIEFLQSLFPNTDLLEIFWKYYNDLDVWFEKLPIITSKKSLTQILGNDIESYLLLRKPSENSVIQNDLRSTIELILIRKALLSDLKLKYLIIDGSMTILEPLKIMEKRDSPRKLPFRDYLLRDICHHARKKGTTLAAISKTHTVPGSFLISKLATDLGFKDHWYCRIPGVKEKEGELNITKSRIYIPPDLAVTYLARFYYLMPTLRIDFDYYWWKEYIQDSDPKIQQQNEIKIFKDLDFMAHEARWYGYPCPPAFAHEDCVITWDQQLIVSDKVVGVGKEMGLNERALISARRMIFS